MHSARTIIWEQKKRYNNSSNNYNRGLDASDFKLEGP